MIVADTSAVVALIDADDQHHAAILETYEADPESWILPWAVLPEVSYLLARNLGAEVEAAFVRDIADEAFAVEWAEAGDLARAWELMAQYEALRFGMVDAVVMATAERLRARAVATLDLRHFGAVKIRGVTKLYPRDQ